MKKAEVKKYIKDNMFDYSRKEIAEELIVSGVKKEDIKEAFKDMGKYLNEIAKKKSLKGFILSLCSFFLPIIGLVLSIFGIKFANIAQRIDKRVKLIKATKVISWIGIVFHIAIIIYLLFLAFNSFSLSDFDFFGNDYNNNTIIINDSIILTKFDIKESRLYLNNSLAQNITGINITIDEINCTQSNITLVPQYNNVTFDCKEKLTPQEVFNFIIKYDSQVVDRKLIVE